MDDLWNNLVAQEERCCLAACSAVNSPHLDSHNITEQINGALGDRFMSYLVGCLRGPLQGREFATKVAALLACFKIRARSKTPDLCQRTNLLFELDKILDHDFSKVYVGMKVLEQTLWFSVRALENQSPYQTFEPGLLPPSYSQGPDSISSRTLQLYCVVRCLYPTTHEASRYWVCDFLQIANFHLAEDSVDRSAEGEAELDLFSLFETENVTSEDEHQETLSSESEFGAALDDSDEYVLGESSDSSEDEDEDDDPTGDIWN